MRLFYFLALIILAGYTDITAKTNLSDKFCLLTRHDGLQGETVSHIVRDSLGRVWIATTNGINMYNGRYMVSVPLADRPYRPGKVKMLCLDSVGTVYATTENGLYALPVGESCFRKMLPEVANPDNVTFIGGRLYIGSRQGLYVWDGRSCRHYVFGSSKIMLDCSVRSVVEADSGKVFVVSRSVISKLDPVTGKASSIRQTGFFPFELSLGQLAVVGRKVFLSIKNHGLYAGDFSMSGWRKVDAVGNIIPSLYNSGDGHICVSVDGDGAMLLDAATERVVERMSTREGGTVKLPSDAVYFYMRDKTGIDWFGFSRHGMAYRYSVRQLFRTFAAGGFTTGGMDVRNMMKCDDGYLIGTFDGFYKVDRNEVVSVRETENAGIVGCFEQKDGKVYVGTYNKGLLVYDQRAGTLSRQSFSPILNTSSIGVMKFAPDGTLWIGTGEGLFVVDGGGRVTRYTEMNSDICGGKINDIKFMAGGDALLISSGSGAEHGIAVWSAGRRTFNTQVFTGNISDGHSYFWSTVAHDSLILLSNDRGVTIMDKKMNYCGELEIPPQLMNEKISSLLDDMRGHYWMVTEKGLFRTDYDMTGVRYFGAGDGLDAQQIYKIYLDADSVLWACTSTGLMYMDSRMAEQDGKPEGTILLYRMSRDGRSLSLGEETVVNSRAVVTLKWNFGIERLELMPVCTDYADQHGRLYEYALNNLNDWRLLNDGETILLENLMMGTNELTIRIAGQKSTARTFHIRVIPSAAAIAELVILLAGIVLLFLWYRYRKNTHELLDERNAIENALVELEEIRQEQEDRMERQEEEDGAGKYNRVKLSEEEYVVIEKKMRYYMEHEQAYLNPNLKRSDIAEAINTSVAKLSQVFSQHLGENYYDFINKYRLEHFKKLIAAGEYKRYTVTALSESCGFKRASFFSTFRKVEGMTPTEYLKSRKIKASQ